MKTTTTLLLLLSLIATTNADDNTRQVKRTEAQKFVDVSNPQLLTIQQFKKKQQQQQQTNNSIGGIGSGFANKLKVAMGELNNSKNAADDTTADEVDVKSGTKREHGRTNIRPRKKKNANDTTSKLTMAQQIKQEQTEGKEEALSKLSLNLGQAIKKNTNGNKRGSREDV